MWRKTPFFDERERAALAHRGADRPSKRGVPDDVYAEAARRFSPDELANLIGAIIAINAWNRVGVGCAMTPEPEQEVTPAAGSRA